VRLTSLGNSLPEKLPFEGVLSSQRDKGQAILVFESPSLEMIKHQAEALNCRIEIHTLPLEEIYKILIYPKVSERIL
jgi:hypothetical protein